jgi:Nucleotidyl transferase AbiEii toxin, Type IV TA system
MKDVERRLAEIGLHAGGPYGFALGGGSAVVAHGILERPTEDIDLFADWRRRADFPVAVDAVIDAYRQAGYQVDVDLRLDTFARLFLSGSDLAEPHKVELVANWREHPSVAMDIGPVMHLDDVMAGKVDALYNRAAPRDFLDLDAALASGRYTCDELCVLAEQADAGFDRAIFAQALAVVDRYPDERFTAYGVDLPRISAMRSRIAAWRAELDVQQGVEG